MNVDDLKLDRRIQEVIEEAERRSGAGADPDEAWFGTGLWEGKGLEKTVENVVGDRRLGGPLALRTSEAYDLVTQHVLTILEESHLSCPWCNRPAVLVCVERCARNPSRG